MKYKILLLILVVGFILSGFIYVGITLHLESKGYDNQTSKYIIGSFVFIIGLPIAILQHIHYKSKYKK